MGKRFDPKLEEAKQRYLTIAVSVGVDVSLLKFCGGCRRFLYKALFHKDRNKLRSKCKLCCVDDQAKKHQKLKAKKIEFIQSLKGNGNCAECGRQSRHLEFVHHNREEKYRYPGGGYASLMQLSITKIKEEVKKGRFICYECHRKETSAEQEKKDDRGWASKRKKELEETARKHAIDRKHCVDCKKEVTEENTGSFQWDHRNPEEKHKAVSFLVYHNASVQVLLAEIAKCDLVCYECHRDRTLQQWKTGKVSYAGKAIVTEETMQKEVEHLPKLPEFVYE